MIKTKIYGILGGHGQIMSTHVHPVIYNIYAVLVEWTWVDTKTVCPPKNALI